MSPEALAKMTEAQQEFFVTTPVWATAAFAIAVNAGVLAIDARMKPSYPEELFCDPDTARTVERRWHEYFPAGGVEMGDSDRAHLD
jgi:hypothetical protein